MAAGDLGSPWGSALVQSSWKVSFAISPPHSSELGLDSIIRMPSTVHSTRRVGRGSLHTSSTFSWQADIYISHKCVA